MDAALEKVIHGFRLNNEAKGLSPKTIGWYHGNLMLFHKWLEKDIGHAPTILEVTTDQIRRYLSGLRTTPLTYEEHPFHPRETRPLSPNSICRYYTSLSSFFNWVVREEIISSSPMKNVPRPKVPKFMPDPFSEEEIRALLKACKDLPDDSALRATAIILVLLDTGVRLNELLGMQMADLDLESGRVKVMGKGAKERYVYFGKTTKRALWRYVSLGRAEPVLGKGNIFLSERGFPITMRYLELCRIKQMAPDKALSSTNRSRSSEKRLWHSSGCFFGRHRTRKSTPRLWLTERMHLLQRGQYFTSRS